MDIHKPDLPPRAVPGWLSGYRISWLRADVVAGLTAAAVVIPKAMAYATIAGLPVQVGLYTAFVPMLIYALFGSSRPLSVSTTTTLAILTGANLSQVVREGDATSMLHATATLSLLVGAILVIACVLRLGFVANLISEPVLIGFKAGIGLVILVDQVPKILGIHFPKGLFGRNLVSIVKGLPNASPATLAIGVTMIVILAGMRRLVPRAPAPLIAVALGIAGTGLLHLKAHGVQTVAAIPGALPIFTPPDPSFVAPLWAGALGIALMTFTETIAAGRAFACEDEPTPRANRELLATGLANAGGALFGSMPAGGGTSQTAVNRHAGARTQLAAIVTAGAALLAMLVLAPLIGMMPEATLAAVVIVYSVVLIQPTEFRAILQIRRMEFMWAVAALAGVVLLGTLKGILVAILISLLALARQTAHPPLYVIGRKRRTNVFRPVSTAHPDDETFPGLLILRIEDRIFFANVATLAERMRRLVDQAKPQVVALELSGVADVEYTALKFLIEAEKRARGNGVVLWLVGLAPEVLSVVQRSTLGSLLGRDRMHFNLETAVAKYIAGTGEHTGSPL